MVTKVAIPLCVYVFFSQVSLAVTPGAKVQQVPAQSEATLTVRADLDKAYRDSLQLLYQDSIFKFYEFRLKTLEAEVRKMKTEKSNQSAKLIGYFQSSANIIFSVMSMRERSITIDLSKRDLEIRYGTETHVESLIQKLEQDLLETQKEFERVNRQAGSSSEVRLKLEKEVVSLQHAIDDKKSNLNDIKGKIEALEQKLNISRMGLNRARIQFGLNVGVFVLTFFLEEVSSFLDKFFMNPKFATLQFLRGWDRPPVQEASIFPTESKHLTPAQKSLMVFASTEELGVSREDLLWALNRFREEEPNRYAELLRSARISLKSFLLKQSAIQLSHISKTVEDYRYSLKSNRHPLEFYTLPSDVLNPLQRRAVLSHP